MSSDRARAGKIIWPTRWESTKRQASLRYVFVVPILGLFVVAAALTMARDVAAAVLFITAAVVLVFWIPPNFLSQVACRWRGYDSVRRARVGSRLSAVFMPYSRPARYLCQVSYGAQALFFLALPLIAGRLESNDPTPSEPGIVNLAWLGPIVAVYTLPWILSYFLRERRPLGIGIAKEGIYTCSWSGACLYAWEDVVAVTPLYRRRPLIGLSVVPDDGHHVQAAGETWLARYSWFRRRMTALEVGYLAVDPALAYAAIAFYLENPDRREELAEQDSVDRLVEADFPFGEDWILRARWMTPSRRAS